VQRSVRAVLVSITAALSTLVFVGGSEAWADPTPSVSQIEAQISALWSKVEPQVEKYNQVHEQYLKNKAKQAQLEAQIDPLARQVELGQLRVGVISAEVYKGGGTDTLSVILNSSDPQQLVDRLSMVDAIARDQQRQLSGVADLKAQYDTQKAPIDQLVATLAAQDADLTAKKKVIDAQIAQLQALRAKAYQNSGGEGSLRPRACPLTYEVSAGYKAAAFACSQAGSPYEWAMAGPYHTGYDCSGLTLRSWAQVGISLPHNAAEQRRSMPYVSRANLKIGDLVFFNNLSHVAIYEGTDSAGVLWIMQAPAPGDVVRMTPISDGGNIHSYGRPNG
jgi:cell wall-associated NlpC family hydrolase